MYKFIFLVFSLDKEIFSLLLNIFIQPSDLFLPDQPRVRQFIHGSGRYHIAESNANSLQATIITPVLQQEIQQTIFIGYINDLHYVSTVTHSNSQLRNRLKYLKRKYSVSEYDKEKKLEKRRANYKKQLSEESAKKSKKSLQK